MSRRTTATEYYAGNVASRVGVDPLLVIPVLVALLQMLSECERDPERMARKLERPTWGFARRMRRAIRMAALDKGLVLHADAIVADVMAECEGITGKVLTRLLTEAAEAKSDTGEFKAVK